MVPGDYQQHFAEIDSSTSPSLLLTSILLSMEVLKMYMPALILFETKTFGFSTKRWICPVPSLYTTTPYFDGSSTLVTCGEEEEGREEAGEGRRRGERRKEREEGREAEERKEFSKQGQRREWKREEE